jgi:hypothetical protein
MVNFKLVKIFQVLGYTSIGQSEKDKPLTNADILPH